MIEQNGKRLFTIAELAAACDISKNTVRTWIKRGMLQAIKPVNTYYITEESIKELLSDKG